jgi:hypothetical protein
LATLYEEDLIVNVNLGDLFVGHYTQRLLVLVDAEKSMLDNHVHLTLTFVYVDTYEKLWCNDNVWKSVLRKI